MNLKTLPNKLYNLIPMINQYKQIKKIKMFNKRQVYKHKLNYKQLKTQLKPIIENKIILIKIPKNYN